MPELFHFFFFLIYHFNTQISLIDSSSFYFHLRFDRRSRLQEKEVLEQGISLPKPSLTTTQDIPPPIQLSPSLIETPQNPPQQYNLPPHTAPVILALVVSCVICVCVYSYCSRLFFHCVPWLVRGKVGTDM